MADFTPQEIEQFLQQFFDVVGARQYVGARYVPIFGRAGESTVEWDDLAPYEPLTVVMHQGVSYVSRRYVPAGIPITDTGYWVQTYRFNAQVEQYRQEVLTFQGQIDQIREDYVPFPDSATYPKYGTLGQVLSTLSDGTTKWEDPVVPSDAQAETVITQWLNDHPEATTTVQDNSLTTVKYQNGSVTDAKLAQSDGILSFVHGDTVVQGYDTSITSANYSTLLPSYNDAEANRVYRIIQAAELIANGPTLKTNTSATLITLNSGTYGNNSWNLQILATSKLTNPAQPECLYWRSCWGGTWTEWQEITTRDNPVRGYLTTITSSNYGTLLASYDDAEINRIYRINGCAEDISDGPTLPTDSSATLVTFSSDVASNKSWYLQILSTTPHPGHLYWRSCWGGTWNAWKELTDKSYVDDAIANINAVRGYLTAITSSNYGTLLASYDDAEINRIYRIIGCAEDISDGPTLPADSSATLITLASEAYANKSWYLQLLSTMPVEGHLYWRSCWGGNWNAWKELADKTYVDDEIASMAYSNVPDQMMRHYFVETCVNKLETKIESTDKIITFGDSITIGSPQNGSWVSEFSDYVGCTAVNRAVAGGLFGHEAEARPEAFWISTQIDNTTTAQWADVKCVFVAAGTNDSGYGTTMGELSSRVTEAITAIKAATNAHIIFITPIRRSIEDSPYNMKLALISGIIENIALANGCSVICGFNFPIPTMDMETYIHNFTSDGLHPNQTGSKVYAQSVINAIY